VKQRDRRGIFQSDGPALTALAPSSKLGGTGDVLAFGDSDEDAQPLEGPAVIVTAKVRGQARHSSTISAPAPTRHAVRTDWGPHRPGSGVTDSAQATTRSLHWDEAYGTTTNFRIAS
jgi:hypothetical protein